MKLRQEDVYSPEELEQITNDVMAAIYRLGEGA